MQGISIGSNADWIGAQQESLTGREVPQKSVRAPVGVVRDKIPGSALEQKGGSPAGEPGRIRLPVAAARAVGAQAHQLGPPGRKFENKNIEHLSVRVVCYKVGQRAGKGEA